MTTPTQSPLICTLEKNGTRYTHGKADICVSMPFQGFKDIMTRLNSLVNDFMQNIQFSERMRRCPDRHVVCSVICNFFFIK